MRTSSELYRILRSYDVLGEVRSKTSPTDSGSVALERQTREQVVGARSGSVGVPVRESFGVACFRASVRYAARMVYHSTKGPIY